MGVCDVVGWHACRGGPGGALVACQTCGVGTPETVGTVLGRGIGSEHVSPGGQRDYMRASKWCEYGARPAATPPAPPRAVTGNGGGPRGGRSRKWARASGRALRIGGWNPLILYPQGVMARCDAMRCDAMRCDAMRYDAIRYDTIRYDTMRYDTMRYDTIRYDTIRYDAIRYGRAGLRYGGKQDGDLVGGHIEAAGGRVHVEAEES
jgi:pentapeptide MXKDX repeat protein